MSNVATLFDMADGALAAYADLAIGRTNDDDLNLPALKRAGMSDKQALEFAKRYPTVIASYDDLPGTGFQATVFADAGGNLTLAIRGTETSGGDFFPTDADILSFGAAYDQIVAMVNWWKRASGDPGTEVEQFRLVEVPDTQIPEGAVVLYPGASMDTSYVLDVAVRVAAFTVAEGNISAQLAADPDHRVEVAGHSTGGHLAMAFSTIFASDATGATVFNAPGFTDGPTNQQFFLKLGGSIPAEGAASVTFLPCTAVGRVKGGADTSVEYTACRVNGSRQMTSRKNARTFLRATAAIALSSALAACAGWVPGRQSYWDAKVKELCKKDGGVTIYEKVRISRADLKRGVLPVNADGKIEVNLKGSANPAAPVYAEQKITYLREGNPVVGRTERIFVRRVDQKIVAKSISYGRGGGDFPSPSQRSSFRCPDRQKELTDLQKLFIVEGGEQ